MCTKQCFDYWGKAKPFSADGKQWHSLPLHSLDVAAVGLQYLRKSPQFKALLRESFAFENDAALEGWLVFCLALHDLGKFSAAFQSQHFTLYQQLHPAATKFEYKNTRHDSLGMLVWKEAIEKSALAEQWFGPNTEDYLEGFAYWMRAVTGHHGLPPDESQRSLPKFFETQRDLPAIKQFVQLLRTEIVPQDFASMMPQMSAEEFLERSQQLSWWLAGLTVLADWLGSNTDFFPYHEQATCELASYWQTALANAEKALAASEILPSTRRQALDIRQLFPPIVTPSPLQVWAGEQMPSDTPQIYLLEDVTGAGKTEAAMLLTQHMLAQGCADGFFIGLPTMATANAMYERVACMYQQLFSSPTSAVLAHGQRNLVEKFADSVLPKIESEHDPRQIDETASARCSSWLADHQKRALLAPAGIGTIDQVLLSVLHSKHQSLRLLGMLRKVLVIDEVHACDAYMQKILEVLLEFHAFIGGSVILLSATLPQNMKQALLNAFARGRGYEGRAAPRLQSQHYPLVTAWSEGAGVQEKEIATRDAVKRRLQLSYLSEQAAVLALIRDAIAQGKAVCWMRNTVADALDALALVKDFLPASQITLFHARFAMAQRLQTEQEILSNFGLNSTPERRAARLVIATQVAEQSLDADWDVVITDLAPIDRMLQRAGRLHRHFREQRGTDTAPFSPCLYVYGPKWQEQPQADWYSRAFPRAAHVYPHHVQLWHSAAIVQQSQISMPDDARRCIEAVFGDEVAIPAGLVQNEIKASGKIESDISAALLYRLKFNQGYQRNSVDWWSEINTPSRLGEPTSSVMLARWDGEQFVPWVTHEKIHVAVALSSLRMASRLLAATAEPSEPKRLAAWEKLREQLPSQGKWMAVLLLEVTSQGWQGSALAQDGKDSTKLKTWRYCDEMGLLEKKE